MGSWMTEHLPAETMLNCSDTSFTNDKITIDALKHFIKHLQKLRGYGLTRETPMELLLMDNHGSHTTPEFIILCNQHNIQPFPFPAHLTHCMQPLDVGLFHLYKHWHQIMMQRAVANLVLDYKVKLLLKNLAQI